jgi:hypothetical protein
VCLVHCVYGQSRSATVVTAYVMAAMGWDADTALAFVRDRRPCIGVNPGCVRAELCVFFCRGPVDTSTCGGGGVASQLHVPNCRRTRQPYRRAPLPPPPPPPPISTVRDPAPPRTAFSSSCGCLVSCVGSPRPSVRTPHRVQRTAFSVWRHCARVGASGARGSPFLPLGTPRPPCSWLRVRTPQCRPCLAHQGLLAPSPTRAKAA